MQKRSVVLIIIPIAALIIGLAAILTYDSSQDTEPRVQMIPKAAIIDQISTEIPNESFQIKAKELFEQDGYEVDIFKTEDITVDFYKNLPKMNYEFIIIRSYGVFDESEKSTYLFTGEKYQKEKYVSEQLFGQIKNAKPTADLVGSKTTDNSTIWFTMNQSEFLGTKHVVPSPFFVVTPKFVMESMVGKFQDTVFILGASYTLESDSLAKSLIERGASTIVGWENKVTNFDSDRITLNLIDSVLTDNLEVQEAVKLIGDEYNSQKRYDNSTLKYYAKSKNLQ